MPAPPPELGGARLGDADGNAAPALARASTMASADGQRRVDAKTADPSFDRPPLKGGARVVSAPRCRGVPTGPEGDQQECGADRRVGVPKHSVPRRFTPVAKETAAHEVTARANRGLWTPRLAGPIRGDVKPLSLELCPRTQRCRLQRTGPKGGGALHPFFSGTPIHHRRSAPNERDTSCPSQALPPSQRNAGPDDCCAIAV